MTPKPPRSRKISRRERRAQNSRKRLSAEVRDTSYLIARKPISGACDGLADRGERAGRRLISQSWVGPWGRWGLFGDRLARAFAELPEHFLGSLADGINNGSFA